MTIKEEKLINKSNMDERLINYKVNKIIKCYSCQSTNTIIHTKYDDGFTHVLNDGNLFEEKPFHMYVCKECNRLTKIYI